MHSEKRARALQGRSAAANRQYCCSVYNNINKLIVVIIITRRACIADHLIYKRRCQHDYDAAAKHTRQY